MPWQDHTPKLRLHKPSGRAVVTLNGKDYYCGRWGTNAAREEYDRLVARWLACGRRLGGHDLTIAELVKIYWKHCKAYYRTKTGKLTSEAEAVRHALRPLLELYATERAMGFGPLALKAVRQRMIERGWCRTLINRHVLRIRQMFRWAVSNEHLPAEVLTALEAVEGLRAGRTQARESEPVLPVDDDVVEATLPHLPAMVADMVRLQRLTGMRPGEVCSMRGCDIDTSGDVWKYMPAEHKTAHHGHKRIIDLGPQARQIVEKYLQVGYLFSPAASERQRAAELREKRKTPLTPSQLARAQRASQGQRRRAPGACYDVAGYRRAIARACELAFGMPADLREPAKGSKRWKADTPAAKQERRRRRAEWRREHVWHPHQLRHTFATRIRAQYGPDVALTLLGDKTTRMIDVYAAKDRATAAKVMAEIG